MTMTLKDFLMKAKRFMEYIRHADFCEKEKQTDARCSCGHYETQKIVEARIQEYGDV